MPTKEQDKSPGTDPSETEIYELLKKIFKTTIIKILNEIRRTMHEQSENFKRKKH